MNPVQSVETVSKVHLTRRRIPNTRSEYRSKVFRVCVPTEHHQIGVKNLLRVATVEAQAVRQVDLAAHPMAADCIRHRVVEKDKHRFFYLPVHLKPVVW